MKWKEQFLVVTMAAEYTAAGMAFYVAFATAMQGPYYFGYTFMWLTASVVFAVIGWLTWATITVVEEGLDLKKDKDVKDDA
jgi:hypothetical protein